MVREACLAGTDARTATDDGGGRRAVMRRAERRLLDQCVLGRQQAGDRVDARHFERGLRIERRKDPGQPPREHRLPRARRAREQQVVASSGGDLERAARSLLPAHVCEVGNRDRLAPLRGCDRFRLELAAEIADRLRQMAHRNRLDAGKRGLRRRLRRTEQPLDAHPFRALGYGKDAAHATEAAVERELADGGVPAQRFMRHLRRSGKHRERYRQVVAGALLPQTSRSEVHGDAAARKLELRRRNATAHALSRLSARTVGQPDDRERRSAAMDMRLNLDAARLEADERVRDRACEHAATLKAKWCRFYRDFATSTSSKYSPARRPVRLFTCRRKRFSSCRPARSRISG